MTISTNLFYDRSTSLMAALTARAETLNTQIATTRKFLSPADDSVAYQRLQGIAQANADGNTYAANVTLAQSILAQADTTLGSITGQLQRAAELTVQAGNGALTPEARAGIADELDGIVATIAALANTKDVRGGALFGTASGTDPVTRNADGSYGFAGTGAPGAIPIGASDSVQPSATAASFLTFGDGGTPSDIAVVLTGLSAALRTGTDLPAAVAKTTADIATLSGQVSATRSSLGARAARVDLEAGRIKDAATAREITRGGIEDTDITATITELQKTITVLQATQASFSKLSSLSLFDYLR